MSKKLLAFCASGFFLLFFMMPQTPLAAPQISIDAEAGIQNKVKYERGVPVRITVSNSGSDFSGDLVINNSESYNLGSGLAVPLDLAAGETKTVQIAVPGLSEMYGMNGTPAQAIFLYEGGWENGKSVSFKGSKSIKASYFSPATLFIGTLTNNPDRLIALKEIDSQSNETSQIFHLNQLEQFALPTDSMGWEFIDYLVIDEVAYSDLPEGVQAAVLQWVRQGGHVLIGSTENMQLAMGNLSEYLPLVLGESEQVIITALENPIPVLQASLADGAEALMEADGQIIVGRTKVGSGTLTQTSFSLGDEPVSGQKNYPLLLQNFFQTPALNQSSTNYGQPLKEAMSYEVGSTNELFESFQVSRIFIVLTILIYIVLIIPVLYLILKKKDKREYAWFIIPAAAVLFSIGLFAFGAKDRIANPQIQQAGFFIVDSSGSLNGYYMNTLLSNRGGNYRFTAPSTTSMTFSRNDEFSQQSPEKAAIFEPQATINSLTVRDMRYWSVGSVIGESYIEDAGKFDIEVSLENKILTGFVQNNFSFALEDVAIWSGTKMIALGDLAPGERLPINVKIQSDLLAPASQIASNYAYQPIANVQELLKARKQSVLAVSFNEIANNIKSPYITGYAKDAIVPISLEGKRPTVSAIHLIAQAFEPAIDLSGEINMNSDDLAMELHGTSSTSYMEQISITDPYLYFLENGNYELTYTLPKAMQNNKMSWNELAITTANTNLATKLINAKNGSPLELMDRQTLVTESVSDFISETGMIKLTLEMDGSGNPLEVTVPKIKLKGEMKP